MPSDIDVSSPTALCDLIRGDGPLLLNVPHAGLVLPPEVAEALRPEAAGLRDTDWHMDRIAREVRPVGASLMVARVSRYAADLNRPRDDTPLYDSATTGLISTIDFDGAPLYRDGAAPDAAARAARVSAYWTPYHAALTDEIARIRAAHGYCLLLDLHSIRSRVPRLFDGRLPDLNLGTNSGASCAPGLARAAHAAIEGHGLSVVRDGRFKGGYITRHYGTPDRHVHALQIEIAQEVYMQETPPWTYLPEKAARLTGALGALIAAMAAFSPEREDG
ncbi:N-formylglutamate deformylase [Mesobaculum littorinae]|uniref:N-formylglutamate deformylase n=1 Tax=Mesobaculum littorinae TaxID=2486419 RepID=A0A438AI37_9RHOB|nr:N-formylglutamate deformylase [Mesobaculum littorinae]RVV98401.1 N-formylglutamate deformylase [Mesobaculum littorinae]